MKTLISLEQKRFSLRIHLISLAAANLIILILSLFTSYLFHFISSPSTAVGVEFRLDTAAIAALLLRAALIVWQAILISGIIIEEYRSKTMQLLYTYPVNRKQLLLAKLYLIFRTMFVFHAVSVVFQNLCIAALSSRFDFIRYSPGNILIQLILILSSISIGFVPMCIGMIKYSGVATIVSSILIVAVASNSQGTNAGLLSLPVPAIILAALGLGLTYYTVTKTLHSDLLN